MGIDWEEILGAEGADMADAYNDSIPEEPYERDTLEEDPYDDPNDDLNDDDELHAEYEALTHEQLVDKCINFEWVAGDLQQMFDSAKQYIKTLMDLLEEHGIQVPEEVKERYKIWTTPYNDPKAASSEEKVDNSWLELEDFWEEEQTLEDLDNKKK